MLLGVDPFWNTKSGSVYGVNIGIFEVVVLPKLYEDKNIYLLNELDAPVNVRQLILISQT